MESTERKRREHSLGVLAKFLCSSDLQNADSARLAPRWKAQKLEGAVGKARATKIARGTLVL